MTIFLFLFGTAYLLLGFVIFIITSLSTIPGVGGLENAYINKLHSWTVGNNFVTFLYLIIMTILWPVHLGLTLYFKK